MKAVNVVPISDRYAMTIEEMASYTGIGEKKLYSIVNEHPHDGFVLKIGNKSLIKREAFSRFLDQASSL